MPEISVNQWRLTADYRNFERGLLKEPGQHLLCVGMTGAGKTLKAVAINKWCLDNQKTTIWFDTMKPDDLNFLLHYTNSATIHYPKGCMVSIKSNKYNLTMKEIENPRHLFRQIEKGLNIVCIRPFFYDSPPFIRYNAEVFHGLIEDAFRKKIKIRNIQIFIDEFQDYTPSKRIQHTKAQQSLGAKIVHNLLQLRSIGIGICAFTQSYGNIMIATRSQFSYYLVCKDPDGDTRDYIGKILLRFAPLFTRFTPDQGTIIHPNGRFTNIVSWPMPVKDEFEVEYEGAYSYVGDETTKRIRVPLNKLEAVNKILQSS